MIDSRNFETPPTTEARHDPRYIRLPKPGTACPHTGLSRSFIFSLLKENKVKSKAISSKDGGRGVRLISLSSLFELIDSTPDSIPGREDDSTDE
jgi:hypothetical protein